MNKPTVVEVDDFNPQAPCNVEWFQRELNLACKDRGIEVRIVWGVDLNSQVAVIQGDVVVRKKYPHPHQKWAKYTRGHFIVRGGQAVGYRSQSGLIAGSDEGLLVPDVLLEQRALDRWIIEQRLRDDVARQVHANARYVYQDGLEIDALGEFPEEGWWTWFHQIENHDSPDHQDTGFCKICSCCRHFDQQGKMCIGRYREPDQRDLDFVRACLADRDKLPVLRDPSQPPTAQEIQRQARKLLDKMEEAERKREKAMEEELAEEISTLLASQYEPKFDIGAAHKIGEQQNSEQ